MREGNGASTGGHLSEELLGLATGDLYHNNLFRVLGIAVGASPADVRQKQKRLDMQRKLGITGDGGDQGLLPLVPPPDAEKTTRALERLNDPLARFLDELMWFSVPPGDVGMQALQRGDAGQARQAWAAKAAAHPQACLARHSLAVLELVMAVDGNGPDSQMSTALAAWRATIADDVFWDHIRERVAELDDARLTTGLIRRLRETMPRMLSLLVARMAVEAAERGQTKDCAELLRASKGSGYGADLYQETVQLALKPIRDRVSAAIASAKNRWTRKPHHGDRIIRELHATVGPLLVTFDRVVPGSNEQQGIHDEVAEAIREGEVGFARSTNQWLEGNKLLEMARKIAIGEQVRNGITKSIDVNKTNAESGNDWCAAGYWDLPAPVVDSLEKARKDVEAGKFDAAITILVGLPATAGYPLARAFAYCLSVKAIKILNETLSDINAPTPTVKKILNNLPNNWRIPRPDMPSYMNPPCLACSATGYTSWREFSFNGQQGLFMCASCARRDDQDREGRKQKVLKQLPEILDLLALATQVDTRDAGLANTRKNILEVARNVGERGNGDAESLRKKLAQHPRTRTRAATLGAPVGSCFFCGTREGSAEAAITVIMCSPQTNTEYLLGSGSTCEYGEVVVPRCATCRGYHVEWPRRIEVWHEAALRTGARENFPQLQQDEHKAKSARDAAVRSLAAAADKTKTAEASVQVERERIGLLSRLFGRPTPQLDSALANLAAAQREHAAHATRSEQAAAQHDVARAALVDQRKRAVASYKAAYRQPDLPDGVRPEGEYTASPHVHARLAKGWIIGETHDFKGSAVRGTVRRTPNLPDFDPSKN